MAAKESHRVQKELYAQRKAAKPNAEVIQQAKRIWADARKVDISKKERQEHIKQLKDIVRGKVQEVVFKHDASRIIQTVRGVAPQTSRGNILTRVRFCCLACQIWRPNGTSPSRLGTPRQI